VWCVVYAYRLKSVREYHQFFSLLDADGRCFVVWHFQGNADVAHLRL
jgi:hypothetical protein